MHVNRRPFSSVRRRVAGALLGALASTSGGAAAAVSAPPRIEITNPFVGPGGALGVWVRCAPGTGAADVDSPQTRHTVLDPRPNNWWFAMPAIKRSAAPGHATLHARCTPGPGSPYVAGTAAYRVSASPPVWAASSTTAESITGDIRLTPTTLTFAGGKSLRIAYLRDVAKAVSALPDAPALAHAQLYRVLSASDPRLRSGNSFCGQRPTYFTVLRLGSALAADIVITVFGTAREPDAASAQTMCASYTYTPAGS